MGGQGIQKSLEEAIKLARNLPASIGVDYGYVYKGGRVLARFGIRFHVPHKISPERLSPEWVLPKKIGGVRCDVIERTYEPHSESHDLLNPLISGALIGNYERATAGTLGFFARNTAGQIGLISNWHVLEYSSTWEMKEQIQQPRNSRDVASTSVMREPATGYDIGFAILNESISCSAEVLNLAMSIEGIEEPKVGTPVVKYGAATGKTYGVIESRRSTDIPMVYPGLGNQTYFLNAFCIKADPGGEQVISDRGDSGSIWVNPKTKKIVGLHVGGYKNHPEIAVAHSASDVLEQLGVNVFTF